MTFAYRGCTLWNELPTNTKSRPISRYQNFKIAVKSHLKFVLKNIILTFVAFH